MDRTLHVGGLELDALLAREWLATNGIGGYACSTIPGLNTRKYHGLLVAAMAPPVRRMVLLSRVEETLWRDGHRFALDSNQYPDVIYPQGYRHLRQFSSSPCPRWTFEGDGWRLQKQLRLLPGQNTVVLTYTLLSGEGPLDLELRPLLAMRPIHELSYQWNGPLVSEKRTSRCHRIGPTSHTPEVFFAHNGRFQAEANWYLNQIYRREAERGYAGLEDLWTPGVVRFSLTRGRRATFVCSSDPIDLEKVAKPSDAQAADGHATTPTDPTLDALRRAAEAFVVSVPQDAEAGRAVMCMSGYPWAAPSGRDTLIAFTGLLLVPGRFAEARLLLLRFAAGLRNGLMPSALPESGGAPQYLGADVSLWFANAVWDYLRYTNDDQTGEKLLDEILKIIAQYLLGADLGIATDDCGLLASRAAGTPTSWMDAKVDDWVVTQRLGRPVELNALWYNALRIAAELCRRYGREDRADALARTADSVARAFNERFWNPKEQCCFDVIEDHGQDPSIRPNQILALSLPFAVLAPERHEKVLHKVRTELLTPRGIRTLSPADPGYQGRYAGNVLARDRAHHNGSAFPWLLGPYLTALLKVRGRGPAARAEAHDLIRPCLDYLLGDGLGQLCELFDGDAPHSPGGLIASAPAVGELLRCYAQDVLDLAPVSDRPATLVGESHEIPMSARTPHPA